MAKDYKREDILYPDQKIIQSAVSYTHLGADPDRDQYLVFRLHPH